MIKETGINPDELFSSGIMRIHPDFRIIALAEPPAMNVKGNWLTSEMLSLFVFHEMRTLSKSEEMNIIEAKVKEIQFFLPLILFIKSHVFLNDLLNILIFTVWCHS